MVASEPRRGIICAGCWTLDRIRLIDHWPAQEQLAEITGNDQQGGGSAHNVALDLRRMDDSLPVYGLGLIGQDPEGDFLQSQCLRYGVDCRGLQRTDAAGTSYTEVYSVTADGRRTFFHHRGANDVLSPEHLGLTAIPGRILHLGLLGLHRTLDSPWQSDANGWITVLRQARALGITTNIELVSISAERIREIAEPCLPYLDYLIVNDREIGGLTGIETLNGDTTDVDACTLAAQTALSRGAMQCVVVHYPGGAVLVRRDQTPVSSTSVPVPPGDIVGSVGAGDAFAAGMLYGLHEGWEDTRCLELAHAVAAASLRAANTVGAVESVSICLAYAAACLNRRDRTVSRPASPPPPADQRR